MRARMISSSGSGSVSSWVPHPCSVDPASEVRGACHVRADGDDPLPQVGMAPGDVREHQSEHLLRRHLSAVRPVEGRRYFEACRLCPVPLRHSQPLGRRAAEAARRRVRVETRPLLSVCHPQLSLQLRHLLFRQDHRVVLRVANGRQHPPLQRVREHDARPVGDVDLGECLPEHREVVTSQVADDLLQLSVVPLVYQALHVLRERARPRQPLPKGLRRNAKQALVHLVRHVVYGRAEQLAVGLPEGCLKPLPVLCVDDLPAVPTEHRPPGLHPDARNNPVQALTVQVDHPQDVGQARHRRLGDTLPDRALVKLRVAQEAYVASHRSIAQVAVRPGVVVGQRREVGCDRTYPDRAGGEVHGIRVLRPAGIGLEPVKAAQRLQVGRIEVSEQVLDRVEGRGSVRLYGYHVARPHEVEVERGEDRGDR